MDSIFKQTLRSEMDFQDIKVKELSLRTGVSQRTLEGYLGSRASIPPADVAVKIANALNVSVEYLVTGKDRQSKNNQDSVSEGKIALLNDFANLLKKFDIKQTSV